MINISMLAVLDVNSKKGWAALKDSAVSSGTFPLPV